MKRFLFFLSDVVFFFRKITGIKPTKADAAYVAIFCCAIFGSQLHAHGFGQSTLIKTSKVGWWSIGQIYRTPSTEKQKVLSYDIKASTCIAATVKAAAESETNCYFKIGFDNNPDITCTPIQEFYMPETKKLTPAYKLKVGDKLLSNCITPKAITSIEFVERPLKIFALRIKKNHNYMVGRHNILTHNFTIALEEGIRWGLTIAGTFGEGAAAGGAAGSWLGPIGIGVCATIGAVGLTGWYLFGHDHKRTTFDADFNANTFGNYFNAQEKSDEKGKASDEKPKEDEGKDEDEKDNERPGGKPIPEKEPFIPGKNSDGKKHPHPKTGQYGWPDEKGDYWIPDKSRHGGFHWDVVSSDGKRHVNIYPGGKTRP